jgi:hypothetical protein
MNSDHVAAKTEAPRPRWRRPPAAHLLLVLGLASLPASLIAQSAISANGVIESKAGGFKFPDGTLQMTAAGADPCPTLDPSDEMIYVGGVCIDKYEASIWDAPVGGNQIIGTAPEDYCNPNGQDCDAIYARSVVGVEPAAYITWLQAQQALANSGKRLPTNAEWQMVVAGTQDPGDSPGSEDCNTNSPGVDQTGQRENCFSRWGAHDMVGNLFEWVADWDEDATSGCLSMTWPAGYGGDGACIGHGDGVTSGLPGAILRGGSWEAGDLAGPFTLFATVQPTLWANDIGFRGAR